MFNIFSDNKEIKAQDEVVKAALLDLGSVHDTVIHNLDNNSSILKDRQALRNMLEDCLFDKPVCVDLLMMAYDENIIADARKYLELFDPELNKYIEILTEKYSITKVYAAWAVITWYKILGKDVPDEVIGRINLETEQVITTQNLQKYEEAYSDDSFKEKITSNIKALGEKILIPALQLYYLAKSDKCPAAAKVAIVAALGYFVLPFDLIPDVLPVAGYSDDLSVLGGTLATMRYLITDAIRLQTANTVKNMLSDSNYWLSLE